MIRSSVDLPEPLGPEQRGQRALGDVERDVVERDEVAEALGDAGGRDHASSSLRGLSRVIASSVASAMTRQQRRRGVGAGEVEVLEALLDEQRQRLGLAGDLAADDADRAELADRARRRQHDAVDDAPADRRQRDAPERLPARGAERRRGLLLLVADLAQHRRDLAHDERQRHEDRREHDPGPREDDLDAGVRRARRRTSRSCRRRGSARGRRRSARSRTAGRRARRAATCRGSARARCTSASRIPKTVLSATAIGGDRRASARTRGSRPAS